MQTNLEIKSLEDDTHSLLAGTGGRCFRLLMKLQFLVAAVPFENLIVIKSWADTFKATFENQMFSSHQDERMK